MIDSALKAMREYVRSAEGEVSAPEERSRQEPSGEIERLHERFLLGEDLDAGELFLLLDSDSHGASVRFALVTIAMERATSHDVARPLPRELDLHEARAAGPRGSVATSFHAYAVGIQDQDTHRTILLKERSSEGLLFDVGERFSGARARAFALPSGPEEGGELAARLRHWTSREQLGGPEWRDAWHGVWRELGERQEEAEAMDHPCIWHQSVDEHGRLLLRLAPDRPIPGDIRILLAPPGDGV